MSEIDTFLDRCGRDPCVWDLDRSLIQDLFNTRYEGVKVEGSIPERKQEQASRHFYMYQQYTSAIYGVLGRGVCIHYYQCIVEGIHSLAPDLNNDYTGHVDVIAPT